MRDQSTYSCDVFDEWAKLILYPPPSVTQRQGQLNCTLDKLLLSHSRLLNHQNEPSLYDKCNCSADQEPSSTPAQS